MNSPEFCSGLYSKLKEFEDALPSTVCDTIRGGIQRFERSVHNRSSREETTHALFDLATCIEQQSAHLPTTIISDTIGSIVTQKIEEISSAVLPPSPSGSSQRSLQIDQQIQQTESLLHQALAALSRLDTSKLAAEECEPVILAMTGSISDLENRLKTLRDEKAAAGPASSQTTSPSTALTCAGLRNVSNKCYAHACLKGLWGSTQFRQMIDRKASEIERLQAASEGRTERPLTALFLHRLFLMFDATQSSEVIEPEEDAIRNLLVEMAKHHPFIAKTTQQDSPEFLTALFDDILLSEEALFTYVERKQRPPSLTVDFCIPAIDLPETIRGNLFIIPLPPLEGVRVNVQDGFEPIKISEVIDSEAVLTSDKNRERDPGPIVETLEKIGKNVEVTRQRVFSGIPPSCLIIHLLRPIKETDVSIERLRKEMDPALGDLTDGELRKVAGRTEGVKVLVYVDIPSDLTAHHIEGVSIPYRLKAVIIHAGQSEKGHYYSYLPQHQAAAVASSSAPAVEVVLDQPPEKRRCPAPSAEHSMAPQIIPEAKDKPISPPASFVCHNDAHVDPVSYGEKIAKDLAENSYILIYDRVE